MVYRSRDGWSWLRGLRRCIEMTWKVTNHTTRYNQLLLGFFQNSAVFAFSTGFPTGFSPTLLFRNSPGVHFWKPSRRSFWECSRTYFWQVSKLPSEYASSGALLEFFPEIFEDIFFLGILHKLILKIFQKYLVRIQKKTFFITHEVVPRRPPGVPRENPPEFFLGFV